MLTRKQQQLRDVDTWNNICDEAIILLKDYKPKDYSWQLLHNLKLEDFKNQLKYSGWWDALWSRFSAYDRGLVGGVFQKINPYSL